MYVMNGTFSIERDDFHGVIVVEGDSGAGGTDIRHGNQARIWTEQMAIMTNPAHNRPVYGYPLAYLLYDPELPAPTAKPLDPQDSRANLGSAGGAEIHGLVYSGGNVEFTPILLDGGVVAFQTQTLGPVSAFVYNPTYGNATPPPGFPEGSGNTVVLVRKSFIVCVNYAADTGGGSLCQ
jgi:hypothetical protein